jgi:DNA-directed RNA polymerase subunit K
MSKRYTRYERARIIGARALQISMGAPPLVEMETNNPVKIARRELELDVLPITVRRDG